MGRHSLRGLLFLALVIATAGVADARGGGGGRRRASKSARAGAQAASILDAAIRRDNVRRSRRVDW